MRNFIKGMFVATFLLLTLGMKVIVGNPQQDFLKGWIEGYTCGKCLYLKGQQEAYDAMKNISHEKAKEFEDEKIRIDAEFKKNECLYRLSNQYFEDIQNVYEIK